MNPRIRLSIVMFLITAFAFALVPIDLLARGPFNPDCPENTITGTSLSNNGTTNPPHLGASGYSNIIDGRAGDDFIDGDNCNDLLIGSAGEDELYGWIGNDVLDGGQHDDDLFGYHGDDVLFGGPGDDTLEGGEGDDVLRGGDGIDHLDGGTNPNDHDICYVEPNIDTWTNCEEIHFQ